MAAHCRNALVLVIVTFSDWQVANAIVHNLVWTSERFNYQAWTASNTFAVGDTIVFTYEVQQKHNVLEVNGDDFRSCNGSFPMAIQATGKDTITLPSVGDFFYICGVHCAAGQRLHIRVVSQHLTSPSASAVPPLPYAMLVFLSFIMPIVIL